MAWADRAARLNTAVFAHLADGLAVFRPKAGDPVADVPVVIAAPEILVGLGDARAAAADATVECAVSALPAAPVKGDRFELGGRAYVCVDRARRRDADGATWIADVEIREGA